MRAGNFILRKYILKVMSCYDTNPLFCSKCLGGLDICALDLLHGEKDGKYYILELNDTGSFNEHPNLRLIIRSTAIGLVHRHAQEDMTHIRDVVLKKMAVTLS